MTVEQPREFEAMPRSSLIEMTETLVEDGTMPNRFLGKKIADTSDDSVSDIGGLDPAA